jgi:hypothetical protein
MDVTVYTRHISVCPKSDDRLWKRCNCPKWLYYSHEGKRVSAKTRSWEKAETLAAKANELPKKDDIMDVLRREVEQRFDKAEQDAQCRHDELMAMLRSMKPTTKR